LQTPCRIQGPRRVVRRPNRQDQPARPPQHLKLHPRNAHRQSAQQQNAQDQTVNRLNGANRKPKGLYGH
jgi:hypothetical protein